MNTPNKLTIARVIMIPFFVAFLMYDIVGSAGKWVALAIFIIASLTDTLDGYLARKYHLVTNFGKFMDPLADKLLVCSALICFTATGQLAAWITIIIIAREFIISGFRLIAADNGIVIAASYWGKFKTVSQMILIILMIMDLPYRAFQMLIQIFVVIAVVLTVVSLVDYIRKNKSVLSMQD
ncbi:MAG TPA: CDP-diacylglycerol--glycerol-3-phosphate 3-phosphatidyltransferase [Candidatus Blautia merdavium]|uniref:CDP-diacylglycerol--glycerol-3-phosphate 3-phosphatidyltransferase n=1 Tax=Candidatus Blautia merdavium TaxID=2838494 RepID=A0A9D2PPT2_9FIRM|nr:CDP-diacylglycerol--glycerol-3-phosphate 3-phosphatidyltransferase [Candidatus Blautia merdavium]